MPQATSPCARAYKEMVQAPQQCVGCELSQEQRRVVSLSPASQGISAPAPWQRTPGALQRHPPAATPHPRRLRRAHVATPPERPGARRRAAPRGLDMRRRMGYGRGIRGTPGRRLRERRVAIVSWEGVVSQKTLVL